MSKGHYHLCIFTILAKGTLDRIYEAGGRDTITEGRRWIEAQELQRKAVMEDKSFLVVFADAGQVGDLLYYAELGEIKVHPNTRISETTFEIHSLTPFSSPRPHKTSLFLKNQGKYVSDGHIRPYSIVSTPAVLLEG